MYRLTNELEKNCRGPNRKLPREESGSVTRRVVDKERGDRWKEIKGRDWTEKAVVTPGVFEEVKRDERLNKYACPR